MISKKIKDLIQTLAHKFGYHVLSKNCISGDMTLFLKGIKSRGISPKNILDIGAHKADWSLSSSEIFFAISLQCYPFMNYKINCRIVCILYSLWTKLSKFNKSTKSV